MEILERATEGGRGTSDCSFEREAESERGLRRDQSEGGILRDKRAGPPPTLIYRTSTPYVHIFIFVCIYVQVLLRVRMYVFFYVYVGPGVGASPAVHSRFTFQ